MSISNAYAPGVIVFIPKLEAVIICLSLPFILYVIVPTLAPGVGSPPESILINTSLLSMPGPHKIGVSSGVHA